MDPKARWGTPDIAGMLKRKNEDAGMPGVTTSANVGPYAVPLGQPLRRVVPGMGKQGAAGYQPAPKKKKK